MRAIFISVVVFGFIFPQVFPSFDPIEKFEREMKEDIESGKVLKGTAARPEGIQGFTFWPDSSPALYIWVRAWAKDEPTINAWAHTTWTIGLNFYVHSEGRPQSIRYGHYYYLKALSWLPRNTRDLPPPGCNPYIPSWAQGQIHSRTYLTPEPYTRTNLQIDVDICLDGDAIMW